MEISTLEDLVNTRRTLEQKYKNLKQGLYSSTVTQKKALEPVTEPLNKLLELAKTPRDELSSPIKKENVVNSTPLRLQPKTVSPTSFIRGRAKQLYDEATPVKKIKSAPSTPDNSERALIDFSPIVKPGETQLEESLSILDVPPSEEDVFEMSTVEPTLPTLSRGYTQMFKQKMGDTAGQYMRKYFSTESEKRKIDSTFGFNVRASGETLMGAYPVSIEHNDIIINGKVYPGTAGLFELLVLKEPSNYNDNDLKNYKKILEQTKVHLTSSGRLKSSSGIKYMNIIKKLFPVKSGRGFENYRYWDDPNELCSRLKLLVSSEAAGNDSHRNEIIEIINELKEAEIIV